MANAVGRALRRQAFQDVMRDSVIATNKQAVQASVGATLARSGRATGRQGSRSPLAKWTMESVYGGSVEDSCDVQESVLTRIRRVKGND